MAEEVNYASVVFKSSKQAPAEAKKEEETVYDEVKVRSETTDQTADTNDEKENNKRRRYQKLACCLGILCVILLVGLVAVVVVLSTLSGEKTETTLLADILNLTNLNDKLSVDNDNLRMERNDLTVELSNLTKNYIVLENNMTNLTKNYIVLENNMTNLTKNYIVLENNMTNLTTRNQELENQKNNLTQQIQNMEKNWNEGNISRAQWTINAYCKDGGKCKACKEGWLLNQNNCYVYNNAKPPGQMTWEEARENCRGRSSDLTVAHTEEEKKIINEYSRGTGFWIGLKVEGGSWKWIDGTDLSDSSWIGKSDKGHCAVSVQGQPWSSALCDDRKQWICVQEALSV